MASSRGARYAVATLLLVCVQVAAQATSTAWRATAGTAPGNQTATVTLTAAAAGGRQIGKVVFNAGATRLAATTTNPLPPSVASRAGCHGGGLANASMWLGTVTDTALAGDRCELKVQRFSNGNWKIFRIQMLRDTYDGLWRVADM